MIISLEGILFFALFNVCLFYQKVYIQQAQTRLAHVKKVQIALLLYGIVATLFGLAFVLYWGWKFSWSDAAILYVFAFVITKFWGLVEAKIRLGRSWFLLFLISFVGLIGFAVTLVLLLR